MATMRTTASRALIAGAALALLAPVGCSKSDDKKTKKTKTPAAKTTTPDKGKAKTPDKKPAATSPAVAKVGHPAPDFSFKAHTGEMVTLSKLKGTPVVLYFYPKDETPG